MKKEQYQQLVNSLGSKITLVAVSKLQSTDAIMQLYRMGQRDFGENYVQELIEKQLLLPHDIRWHFIGHLQSNKIKYIASFVHLVQSVDSFKLLMEINRQGKKLNRVIDCLLQVHIADEETKFGLHPDELEELVAGMTQEFAINELDHVRVTGLMGMASLSEDEEKVRREMQLLAALYDKYIIIDKPNFHFQQLSMGMSADYKLALGEGSTMVRIGSLLFGSRTQI
ncbi:MAG: YggS family pyridoxal phosphate-dependent enzyme [Chitinophagaceae bacterium]|nr:YggS family pyridoxal phosphate-dependent enzyme [Chitinophagaceae bacterium]